MEFRFFEPQPFEREPHAALLQSVINSKAGSGFQVRGSLVASICLEPVDSFARGERFDSVAPSHPIEKDLLRPRNRRDFDQKGSPASLGLPFSLGTSTRKKEEGNVCYIQIGLDSA